MSGSNQLQQWSCNLGVISACLSRLACFSIVPATHAWSVCLEMCTRDSCAYIYEATSARLVCRDVAETHFEFEELAYTWYHALFLVLVQSFCAVGLDSVDAGPAKKISYAL